MQALSVEKLPEGRALVFKNGNQVRLVSRNNKPLNFPPLVDALKSLPAKDVILDGQIVALDEKGRPSFQLLQNHQSSETRVPLVYYVFDLLFLESKDLRNKPLSQRRKLLAGVLKKASATIRFSTELKGSREDLLRLAQEFGLEGLVAKRPDSLYESGQRSGAWVKVKLTLNQKFVIGGYTMPEGAQQGKGRLLRITGGLQKRYARIR